MGKSKRFAYALGCLLIVAGLGALLLVVGVRMAAQHLPQKAILHIEIFGDIPEGGGESPLSPFLEPRLVSRQDLRDALVKAKNDKKIKAVRLKIHDCSASMATVQEVREQLRAVAAAGKPTYAYLPTAGEGFSGNMPYFLATACEKVVLGPLGDLTLLGLRAEVPFIRGTLDKLGIEPDFPGIGDYKTARNFFTEKELTPTHREMTTWLLDSLARQMAQAIASSRKLSFSRVQELMAQGPFSAEQALAHGLVDDVKDWSSFAKETSQTPQGELKVVSLRRYLRAGRPDRKGAPIAVVVADGGIARGESGHSPMPIFGGDLVGSETMARVFARIRDSDAKAVIFRINSPGGSAVASEIIRLEMEKTAKKIPVVVSMGDVAASGGYWITCGAQRVLADPGTITASIGVFAGHLAMAKFWEEKLGVTWGEVSTSPNADTFGSLHPWTPEQKRVVQSWLDRIYEAFLERVSAARKLPREQVDAVGRGRVFTGEQALERGLIDRLGGFDAALEEAKALAGLKPEEEVELRFYPRSRSFVEQLLSRLGDEQAWDFRDLVEAKVRVLGPVWLPPIRIR